VEPVTTLRLAPECRARLVRASQAAAPDEACGLLVGHRVRAEVSVFDAPSARNVAADPARAFTLDPGEVVALHDSAARLGASIVGTWHSHPAGAASPSRRDLAGVWPGHVLVIVAGDEVRGFAVEAGRARELTLARGVVAPVTSAAMTPTPADPLDIERLAAGVRDGDRAQLARAITLVESARAVDAPRAQALLARVGPPRGAVHRVGISGAPGVGKSTLVDALGLLLVERGHRVAVLAVDPSSTVSGGSILGDKSRMARLARSDAAFIRPSPSAASLGGVARRTRESLALVEAAGYDVVLVETVGVGQSEVAVAGMVDTFVVLLLPGAGDELQGIKKGILELADVIAVTKCDGDNVARARAAVSDHSAALRYLRPRDDVWTPRTLAVSAATGEGLDALWKAIEAHRAALAQHGRLEPRREEQRVRWVWARVEEGLMDAFRAHAGVAERLPDLLERARLGAAPAAQVAEQLLKTFRE